MTRSAGSEAEPSDQRGIDQHGMDQPGMDQPGSVQGRAAWQAWHSQREADLRRPHDWLSVSNLQWVRGTDQQLPGVPGRWSARGGDLEVFFEPVDGVRVLTDGTAAPGVSVGTFGLQVPAAGSRRFALVGQVLIEVIRRAGCYAVRLRDPQTPTRTGFTGVPVFDYDPAWVIAARMERFDTPRPVPVASAAPGLEQVATTIGTLTMRIDGQDHVLRATGSARRWHLSFSDDTSGTLTSAWRGVPVQTSGAQRGLVDFNRAINFPCAFTDFGTCPAPVAGNHLPVAVLAGERAPHGRAGVPPASPRPTPLPGG